VSARCAFQSEGQHRNVDKINLCWARICFVVMVASHGLHGRCEYIVSRSWRWLVSTNDRLCYGRITLPSLYYRTVVRRTVPPGPNKMMPTGE
jgi:hypothetical protein